MNGRLHPHPLTLSIAAVERDTGLSKDTLRGWERRYGFPKPGRDAVGERAYTLEQVDKLRLLTRLLEAGHRPGRIVPLEVQALRQLVSHAADPSPGRAGGAEGAPGPDDLQGLLALVRSHDLSALRSELTRWLARCGTSRFVIELAAPLSAAVGDAWVRGQMEVFEEHACSELLQSVLRQAIAGLSPGGAEERPRVLLTSLPDEPHGLGLLMAEALFALEGCRCVSLGVQTPVWDIVRAATAYRCDIVALSFSGCMNPNQAVAGLRELVAKLPPAVRVWAGGAAPVLQRRGVAGVLALNHFGELPLELQRWRADNLKAARA